MSLVLSKKAIKKLIQGAPSLIENYMDLENQLQPNGLDLTLLSIASLDTSGTIAVSNNERKVSELKNLEFGADGYIHLEPGIYSIKFNEIISMPEDIMALATPRSSLLRCGVSVHTAVWDAGYSGRSESLMTVYNPKGFKLQKNARVIQLIFFKLSETTEGYSGTYQNENLV